MLSADCAIHSQSTFSSRCDEMKILGLLLAALSMVHSLDYDESIGEMLSQCNLYQHEVSKVSRVKHLCEKPDFDDDFSYFIEPMECEFSKRKFLCFLFFKDEYFKLRFKLWFSHSNYSVNAVSSV